MAQFNLADDTLDHLTHALDIAAKHYTAKLAAITARPVVAGSLAATKAAAKQVPLRTRLAEVRHLQSIFAPDAFDARTTPPGTATGDTDFIVVQDGSVFTFDANTTGALQHAKGLGLDSWQWLGSHRFAVDHRLAPNLCYQLREDGFSVHVR